MFKVRLDEGEFDAYENKNRLVLKSVINWILSFEVFPA